MISEFQTYGRKIDLLLRPSSFTHQRFTRVDYLNHLGRYEKYAFSRQPIEQPNFLTVVSPMDHSMWLFLIVTSLAISVVLVTIDKFYSWWNDINYEDTVYKSTMALSFSFTFF